MCKSAARASAPGCRRCLSPPTTSATATRSCPGCCSATSKTRREQTQQTISPLFVRSKTPTSRVLGVGLLAWDSKREISVDDTGASERHRDSVLFPLYYRRQRGERTMHLSPLGGRVQHPHGATWLGALAYGFHRDGDANGDGIARRGGGFLPLIHHETRTDAAGEGIGSTTAVFPLFLRDRRPERDLDVWTPLVWRGNIRGDRPRKSLSVVPFYFGQRQKDGVDVDASVIFVWSRNRARRTHTIVAGPFYHRLTRDKVITGLGPLSYWEDSPERRLLFVTPLVFSLENKLERKRTTVALPFWIDTEPNTSRRFWMAFPFVLGSHRKHDFTKAGIAFPLFYDIHRLHRNFRFTGVVPLLFRYQKGGFLAEDEAADRYTLWGSFPAFFYGRDGKGRRTHSALGLYLWDKDPEGWKLFTPLVGVAQKPRQAADLVRPADLPQGHQRTAHHLPLAAARLPQGLPQGRQRQALQGHLHDLGPATRVHRATQGRPELVAVLADPGLAVPQAAQGHDDRAAAAVLPPGRLQAAPPALALAPVRARQQHRQGRGLDLGDPRPVRPAPQRAPQQRRAVPAAVALRQRQAPRHGRRAALVRRPPPRTWRGHPGAAADLRAPRDPPTRSAT